MDKRPLDGLSDSSKFARASNQNIHDNAMNKPFQEFDTNRLGKNINRQKPHGMNFKQPVLFNKKAPVHTGINQRRPDLGINDHWNQPVLINKHPQAGLNQQGNQGYPMHGNQPVGAGNQPPFPQDINRLGFNGAQHRLPVNQNNQYQELPRQQIQPDLVNEKVQIPGGDRLQKPEGDFNQQPQGETEINLVDQQKNREFLEKKHEKMLKMQHVYAENKHKQDDLNTVRDKQEQMDIGDQQGLAQPIQDNRDSKLSRETGVKRNSFREENLKKQIVNPDAPRKKIHKGRKKKTGIELRPREEDRNPLRRKLLSNENSQTDYKNQHSREYVELPHLNMTRLTWKLVENDVQRDSRTEVPGARMRPEKHSFKMRKTALNDETVYKQPQPIVTGDDLMLKGRGEDVVAADDVTNEEAEKMVDDTEQYMRKTSFLLWERTGEFANILKVRSSF